MTVPRSLDARLQDLQKLLNSILQERTAPSDSAQSHWELPILPPPDPEGRLTSTDLLTWWFRAHRGQTDSWDDYFSEFPSSDAPIAAATREQPIPDDAAVDSGLIAQGLESRLFPEVEEQLADEHAQAAVDCLYDWLHAVGRREIDEAMSLVAEEYHSMEDDEEINCLGLRQRLEMLVDELHGWDLELSLEEVPEPMSHPYGILISAEIQLDAYNPANGNKACQVEHRIVLLRADTSGDWKIHALSLVEQ